MRYDFSEPQQGKDICDRVLCPMKATIRKYCAEGHDIMTVADMREALKERPVRGTTAAVSILDESSRNLQINKIKHFSEYHNFQYDEIGLWVWKAYAVGPGKLIPWQSLYSKHQGPTNISQKEGQEFFESTEIRELPTKKCQVIKEETEDDGETLMFVCPEEGCSNVFESFSELKLHIDVGVHEVAVRKTETLYDRIRRDWAEKFASIEDYQFKTTKNQPCDAPVSSEETFSPLDIGWALGKPRTGGVRFSEKVRMYLTAKFDMGERTGRKADPDHVAHSMRNARNERNERLLKERSGSQRPRLQASFHV